MRVNGPPLPKKTSRLGPIVTVIGHAHTIKIVHISPD